MSAAAEAAGIRVAAVPVCAGSSNAVCETGTVPKTVAIGGAGTFSGAVSQLGAIAEAIGRTIAAAAGGDSNAVCEMGAVIEAVCRFAAAGAASGAVSQLGAITEAVRFGAAAAGAGAVY
ncbi:hypothetical protein GA029_26520 [Bacteroides thetaiotaomicron]|nr:hypothetical protein GA029_26520 [Bacteroides thetaiotaomicron]